MTSSNSIENVSFTTLYSQKKLLHLMRVCYPYIRIVVNAFSSSPDDTGRQHFYKKDWSQQQFSKKVDATRFTINGKHIFTLRSSRRILLIFNMQIIIYYEIVTRYSADNVTNVLTAFTTKVIRDNISWKGTTVVNRFSDNWKHRFVLLIITVWRSLYVARFNDVVAGWPASPLFILVVILLQRRVIVSILFETKLKLRITKNNINNTMSFIMY